MRRIAIPHIHGLDDFSEYASGENAKVADKRLNLAVTTSRELDHISRMEYPLEECHIDDICNLMAEASRTIDLLIKMNSSIVPLYQDLEDVHGQLREAKYECIHFETRYIDAHFELNELKAALWAPPRKVKIRRKA